VQRHTGRYSIYIRPFSYVLDLIIINYLVESLVINSFNGIHYHLFVSLSWIFISWNVGFYEVYRFTKVSEILEKIVKQYITFTILNFAYLGYFLSLPEPTIILKFVSLAIAIIAFEKLFIYYFLRKYRVFFGGNFRRVVIIGEEKNTNHLIKFFNKNPNYGYKLINKFDLKGNKKQLIQECQEFVMQNNVDEIYCALADLSNTEVNNFIDFSDNNLKILKFIPNKNEPVARNLILDYYGYIPIISLRNFPLDIPSNIITKRVFDFIFSIIIIVGILSWLIPILAIIIKLESKGPVFFKQRRNGLNYHEFYCYKFRSMNLNDIADLEQVSKNDERITKVGHYIRKTSIDELPQFFNVLLGEMSVVGPRPHMVSHTEMYSKRVDKFMVRHFIKPGITGLAQTNGFRGEVENDKDIIDRVKQDIFYLENWSLFLDIKIIFITIFKTLKGDEKAY
jgi:putative colanic acid biosynthesis UDP-glucose lipid carrier transferase